MSSMAESMRSSSARAVPLRKRPDLTAESQRYQGKTYWIIKEPVGLNYFRFQEEEYFILQMLDGFTSLDNMKERFEREFAPQKIELADLQRFIGMLHQSNLVLSNAQGQGPQLKRRRDEKVRKERLATFSNVLAIRIRGIDPERFLNWTYPLVRWFFTWQMFVIFCIVGSISLGLVLLNMEQFVSKLPSFNEFFGPKNWLLLGLVLAGTKVLHELGHGFACKHWGGECHEMGIMFLVLTPCLYCNVSDSWMLPSKWRRAAIGAAGMYVELTLASFATLVWWFSEPGMVHNISLKIMFISSVSTIMFNANPLLRYDGYYILSDIVEIPNLRQKASSVTMRMLQKYCLGMKLQEDPFLPKRNPAFFATFTVASVIYRWVVVISILMFLNKVFEPIGLKVIGQSIAAVGAFGLVGMPMWKLIKFFRTPGRVDQVKWWPNFYVSAIIVAAVIIGILYMPLPFYVRCAVEVRPQDPEIISISTPGKIQEVFVSLDDATPGKGIPVTSGTPLAELENIDLQIEMIRLYDRRNLYLAQLQTLRHQRFIDSQAGDRIEQIEEVVETLDDQIAERKKMLDALTITAEHDGFILPPPRRESEPESTGRLPQWSGTPLDSANRGAFLQKSDRFCSIYDPKKLEAYLVIDQSDIELVSAKLLSKDETSKEPDVYIRLDAHPLDDFESSITEISRDPLEYLPKSLTAMAGGEVAAITDPATGMQKPQSTTYAAIAQLDNTDGRLQVGMRGRAKVFIGWKPLWFRLWRYLSTTFHFNL